MVKRGILGHGCKFGNIMGEGGLILVGVGVGAKARDGSIIVIEFTRDEKIGKISSNFE